ncbi:MAG: acyl-CoA desaturase [Deltaproteobacteria bacterium]|nr:acyl-CoA desaturase [Deltaproteobacteria bacterium]
MVSRVMKFFSRFEWSNLLFIILSPVVAIVGTVWVISHGGPHWATWLLAFVLIWFTGIGITAGYHRLFSHKSYQAHWAVRLFYLLFGGATFEGSAREWCCAHRKHHQFVDTDRDPYNVKKGFWHAHVFWVVLKSDQSDESNIKDLKKDPLVRFQDRFYVPLAILVSFIFPAALASLWGDMWGGLFVAGWLRLVVNHHLTFLINSYAHTFGSQNFSDANSSRDSWLLAFLTYGEGFHNFHHSFSSDYRNGIRAIDWDPAKWLVSVFGWMGLASRLNRADPQVILASRLTMDEKRLRARLARNAAFHKEWEHFLAKARLNLEQAHIRLISLKGQKVLRSELEKVKQEFKKAMGHWSALVSGQLSLPI